MSPQGQAARLDRLCGLMEERTGVRLPPNKRQMVESRLGRRAAELRLGGVGAYLDHLFDGGALESEFDAVVDALTTNKTDFFREPDHFDVLAREMIPRALARGPGPCRFRLWSAAASTGAEAWSAAMVLAEAAARQPRLDWAVLGTDIAPRVIAVARRAVYPEAELEPVPAALREAWTVPALDADPPRRRIVPELRGRVRFGHANLVRPPYAVSGGLDVIFLRNVLIYFDAPTQARVIAGLARHLRPGGHLLVGHSESMTVAHPDLVPVAPAVFRLREALP